MENTKTPDWQEFHKEGKRYLQIVQNSVKKENSFSPEILYNLSCMSIEKLFMSYFLKVKKMPMNHTLIDLVDSMKALDTVPSELENNLLYMNSFQEICSIDLYQRKIPSENDLQQFITTLEQTNKYIQELLKTA